MKIWLRRLYGLWALLWFILPFLIFLPFFHLLARKESWHPYTATLNRWWARIFFAGSCIPYTLLYKEKLPQQPCIYCANHASWIDIITMGLIIKGDFVFLGKHSLTKIPLFGRMFGKIHITVNRESKIDAFRALVRAKDALHKGRSVMIFPEGGIKGEPTALNLFKDGAFRVALDCQIPIVPVTILYNWKILDKNFNPNWHKGKAIIHPAIQTTGLTLQDLEALKAQTFEVMNSTLIAEFGQAAEIAEKNLINHTS